MRVKNRDYEPAGDGSAGPAGTGSVVGALAQNLEVLAHSHFNFRTVREAHFDFVSGIRVLVPLHFGHRALANLGESRLDRLVTIGLAQRALRAFIHAPGVVK